MKELLKQRKGFNFYRSYYDMFNLLPEKDRLEFITAILEKQFEGTNPDLEGMALFAYTSQKHTIDSQVDGFLSKMKHNIIPINGGIDGPSIAPTEPPYQQEQEKEQEKEKGKEEVKEKVQAELKNSDGWRNIISYFPLGKKNGSDEAKLIWDTLSSKEQQNVLNHLKKYIKDTEERYIKQIGKYFNERVWEKSVNLYSKPKIKSLDARFIEWYRIKSNLKRFDDARTKLAVLQLNLPEDFIELENEFKGLITEI